MSDNTLVGIAVKLAEGFFPAAQPFHPLIMLGAGLALAHFKQTGSWPTEDELKATLPEGWETLQETWANWRPSNDGSLPPRPTP